MSIVRFHRLVVYQNKHCIFPPAEQNSSSGNKKSCFPQQSGDSEYCVGVVAVNSITSWWRLQYYELLPHIVVTVSCLDIKHRWNIEKLEKLYNSIQVPITISY